MDLIDITQPDPVWDPTKWINCNQKYPPVGQEPPELRLGRAELLKIPKEHQNILPHPTLPVLRFIEFKLPPISNDLISWKVEQSFSRAKPTAPLNLHWLLNRPVPPMAHIRKFDNALGQQWLDGAQSFIDYRYKGHECLPFWILTWWKRLAELVYQKSCWEACVTWLNEGISSPDSITRVTAEEAMMLLRHLPWNDNVDIFGVVTSTLNLALLPSSKWLDSVLLDMMIGQLTFRGSTNSIVSQKVLFQTTAFQVILDLAKKRKNFAHPMLRKVVNSIKQDNKECLYFIYNQNNQHWIPFEVNFAAKTITYGQSFTVTLSLLLGMLMILLHNR